MVIFIASIIIALLFLFLGFLSLRKDWTKTFTLCLFFAFGSFVIGQEWFQGFIKSQVLSIVLTSLTKYGDKLDEFHNTTQRIQQDLSKQQEDISRAQLDIKNVQQRIEAQQKKLENVELLVKNIFERITNEIFFHTEQNRMLIYELTESSAVILFLLKSTPIYQTVQIQRYIDTQPKDSYIFHKNIAILFWRSSLRLLRERSFIISYVSDPTTENPYTTFNRKEREIYADGNRVLWLSDQGNLMLVVGERTFILKENPEDNTFTMQTVVGGQAPSQDTPNQ